MKNTQHSAPDILEIVPIHSAGGKNNLSRDLLLQQFGKRLRLLRKGLGFSRKALAENSGLHYVYIGGIERGEDNISILSLIKIASVLQIPLVNLLDDEFAEPQK